MEKRKFHLLTYHLEAQIFLREVAPDVLTFMPWYGSLRNVCFTHSPTSHLTALHKNFATPVTLHSLHLSCVSDLVGQYLLPHTSSLATCDATLGGLPNGLGILCSGPAYANIFLTRVYQKSLCEIFLPQHKELIM